MEIMLIQPVRGLGGRGDVKTVKDGYARNYLLPRGLAITVNDPRASNVKQELKLKQTIVRLKSATVSEQISHLNKSTVNFEVKSSITGTLFKAIDAGDVGEILGIDQRYISLEPIKKVGQYQATINFNQVLAKLQVNVIAKQ